MASHSVNSNFNWTGFADFPRFNINVKVTEICLYTSLEVKISSSFLLSVPHFFIHQYLIVDFRDRSTWTLRLFAIGHWFCRNIKLFNLSINTQTCEFPRKLTRVLAENRHWHFVPELLKFCCRSNSRLSDFFFGISPRALLLVSTQKLSKLRGLTLYYDYEPSPHFAGILGN